MEAIVLISIFWKTVMIVIGIIIIILVILFLLFCRFMDPNPKPLLWWIRRKAYNNWKKDIEEARESLAKEEEWRKKDIAEEKIIILSTANVKVVIMRGAGEIELAIDELAKYSERLLICIEAHLKERIKSIHSLDGMRLIKLDSAEEPKEILQFLEKKGMHFQRFFDDEPSWTIDQMEI